MTPQNAAHPCISSLGLHQQALGTHWDTTGCTGHTLDTSLDTHVARTSQRPTHRLLTVQSWLWKPADMTPAWHPDCPRDVRTLPFILIVMTSGTAVMGGDGGWRGDGQNGGCGAVGGADDGVLGDDCRRLAATVALSNARNDWAATGSNSFRSSANDESMFAASVGTS
jgi:hypothetical protein